MKKPLLKNKIITSLAVFAFPLISPNWATHPPTEISSLDWLIKNIVNILLGAAGFVAMLFIFIGGYLWITSAGDPSQVEKGKKTLTYAAAGLVLVLLAGSIVNIVINFLK